MQRHQGYSILVSYFIRHLSSYLIWFDHCALLIGTFKFSGHRTQRHFISRITFVTMSALHQGNNKCPWFEPQSVALIGSSVIICTF